MPVVARFIPTRYGNDIAAVINLGCQVLQKAFALTADAFFVFEDEQNGASNRLRLRAALETPLFSGFPPDLTTSSLSQEFLKSHT